MESSEIIISNKCNFDLTITVKNIDKDAGNSAIGFVICAQEMVVCPIWENIKKVTLTVCRSEDTECRTLLIHIIDYVMTEGEHLEINPTDWTNTTANKVNQMS